MSSPESRPEGFQRVSAALAAQAHPHAPLWLDVAARTAQEAADALGVTLGQIAKSVVFRRKADDAAVLVITSGDRRVDEKKVQALVCAEGQKLGRADADFVREQTGYVIGGVAPLGHAQTVHLVMDADLQHDETVLPQMLARAAEGLAPHDVAFYLRELAAEFHSYYNAERILVEVLLLRVGGQRTVVVHVEDRVVVVIRRGVAGASPSVASA